MMQCLISQLSISVAKSKQSHISCLGVNCSMLSLVVWLFTRLLLIIQAQILYVLLTKYGKQRKMYVYILSWNYIIIWLVIILDYCLINIYLLQYFTHMKKQALLKTQNLPNHLLSKDKKTNNKVQKHFFTQQIRGERNKVSQLLHNFQPGYIQPQKQGQQTLKVTQKQISDSIALQNSNNIFDLKLDMGNYKCQYSRNGSTLMLTSSKGHVALLNWRQKQLKLQLNYQQAIHSAKFLHDDTMIALCQPNNLYVYDQRGIQIHKLDRANAIQYLPYHFLLVAHDQRKLKYYDTTTGHIVADHIAKNNYTVMRQNPSNAIIALGSGKGVVQWWTPGVGTPAVKLFCGASITDIGFHKGYMYTASQNIKIWDSRMLKVLQQYPLHRRLLNMQISQSGLLAKNYGFKIEIMKDAHVEKQTHPYLIYNSKSTINNCKFVAFEDFLGLGTASGFSSICVPGSGIPNYDSFEVNPFETKKQKRQLLVHKLLEKLSPETIVIDPNAIGNIDKTSKQVLLKEQKEEKQKRQRQQLQARLKKKKLRGRNSISRRLNRKNIELEKKRREELTENINTKLWAKWAEKQKKEKELDILKQLQSQQINVNQLPKKKKIISKKQTV